MAKTTKKNSAETRKALLKAALKVFSHKGYSRTNLVEVAREAGLTRGALYWHFPDKFELFKALLNGLYCFMDKKLDVILNSDYSPMEKMCSLLSLILKLISELPELKAIDEILLFHKDGGEDMEKLFQMHVEYETVKRKDLMLIIEEALACGEISSQYSSTIIATSIHCYMHGVTHAFFFDETPMSNDEKIDTLVKLFLNGIAADKNKTYRKIAIDNLDDLRNFLK